jgi:hypothetical protein
VEEGWEFINSEDARHCSILCICKYFVVKTKEDRPSDVSPNESLEYSFPRTIRSLDDASLTDVSRSLGHTDLMLG